MSIHEAQPNIFYSLPEVWDFCLEKIYDKPKYIQGLLNVLTQCAITEKSLLLDAGCGSGFPSIDLIEKGYRVIGTDKSSEMVRQVQLNAQKRGVSIEAYHVMWADLARRFDAIFDFVYCRGNSLVYAASWEQNWIVPERSREEIMNAIRNFYTVVKPGGYIYVDKTNQDEQTHTTDLGVVQTNQGPVALTWTMAHDPANRIRTWTIRLRLEKSGVEREHLSYSYLLSHDEMMECLQSVGFTDIRARVPVDGETNYDVYLARK